MVQRNKLGRRNRNNEINKNEKNTIHIINKNKQKNEK